MHQVSDTHLQELFNALYEAAVEPLSWPDALRRLVAWTEADAVMLVVADDGRRHVTSAHGHEPGYLDEYGRDWLRDDPRLAPAAGLDARRHEQRLTAFRKWQATNGFAASFADRMCDRDGAVTWLLVSSRDEQRQGRVAVRYGRVRRDLERALLLTRRQAELTLKSDELTRVVDDSEVGVLLLDTDGSVRHANTSAWRILVLEDALQLRDGRLHALRDADDRRLQAMIGGDQQALSPPGSTAWLGLPRRGGEPAYTIAVRGSTDHTMNGCRRVFIGDATASPAIRAADLGVIFDLTAREAQVCVRLLRGLCLEDCATDLGISPRTARVYLQQVYSKVGVHRQAELVRLLMRCPAAARPSPAADTRSGAVECPRRTAFVPPASQAAAHDADSSSAA